MESFAAVVNVASSPSSSGRVSGPVVRTGDGPIFWSFSSRVDQHDIVLIRAGSVQVVLRWLVLSAQREHRLAEDHLRRGVELALARVLEHLEPIVRLVR
eukprot:4525098-Pleurochrysis_carterae.AAC.3